MQNFTYDVTFQSSLNVTIEAEDDKSAQLIIDQRFRNKELNPRGETIVTKKLTEIDGESVGNKAKTATI